VDSAVRRILQVQVQQLGLGNLGPEALVDFGVGLREWAGTMAAELSAVELLAVEPLVAAEADSPAVLENWWRCSGVEQTLEQAELVEQAELAPVDGRVLLKTSNLAKSNGLGAREPVAEVPKIVQHGAPALELNRQGRLVALRNVRPLEAPQEVLKPRCSAEGEG